MYNINMYRILMFLIDCDLNTLFQIYIEIYLLNLMPQDIDFHPQAKPLMS